MPDARHPKQYPRGAKFPKLGVNDAWKRRVDQKLDANKKASRSPSTRAELARMVGADKAGLNRMLDTPQDTYKYAKPICDILGIEPAMIENHAIESDELDRAVADLRALPPAIQTKAARMLRILIDEPS